MHRMADDDHKYAPLLGDYERGSVLPRFCLNKTPLERKLILLSIVLALTTFCLIIAVAVLDHKYHEAEMHTSTVAPETTTTPTTPIPTTTTTIPTNTTQQPTSTATPATSTTAPTNSTTAPTTSSQTTTTPTTSSTTVTSTTTATTNATTAVTNATTATTPATTSKPTVEPNVTTMKTTETPMHYSTETTHSSDLSTEIKPTNSIPSRKRRNPTEPSPLDYDHIRSSGTTFYFSKWTIVAIFLIYVLQ